MNTLDIIILIILLIGGLNGLRQGFIKAFANLVGWIFALIVGAKYAVILAPAMSSLSQDPVVQKIAAFAFIVLIIVVCMAHHIKGHFHLFDRNMRESLWLFRLNRK